MKFWTWLAQLQKQKGTPILTGEQQKRLVEEAGFIDIEVIEKRIDFGSWSEGLIPFPLTCSTKTYRKIPTRQRREGSHDLPSRRLYLTSSICGPTLCPTRTTVGRSATTSLLNFSMGNAELPLKCNFEDLSVLILDIK